MVAFVRALAVVLALTQDWKAARGGRIYRREAFAWLDGRLHHRSNRGIHDRRRRGTGMKCCHLDVADAINNAISGEGVTTLGSHVHLVECRHGDLVLGVSEAIMREVSVSHNAHYLHSNHVLHAD